MSRSEKWKNQTKSINFSDPKRLTILMLTWEFPPHIIGGLARHTEGLATHLQKMGVDVHIITAKPSTIEPDYEEVQGVKVFRVSPLNELDQHFLNWIGGLNLAIAKKAMKLANQYQYSLIHAHDWLVGDAAKSISKNLDLPLITTIHGTEYGRNAGIYTELQQFIHMKEKELVSISNEIIVCSEFMKEEVMNLFSAPIEKIAIIPNGVQISTEEENIAPLHPILMTESRKIIFTIGRLVKEKGFDLIIEAASKINRDDICFVIAGHGPMYHEYESLINKHNLNHKVYLIGFINDQQRNQFLEKCVMAVFPSRYEPFGIVALEAMKFSKPIIVTKTGGLKGINKHLETGLFMETDDVEALVNQIDFILSNPDQSIKMGLNGKKIVDYFYSWHRVAEMTKRMYEEVDLLSSINEELLGSYNK